MFIQPERIKIIGAVVVIGDGLPVTLFRVARAPQFWGITRAEGTGLRQTQQAFSIAHLYHLSPALIHDVISKWQDGFDISFDVKVIVNIRFAQVQFTGRQEHLTERAWMLEHQREAWWLSRWRF